MRLQIAFVFGLIGLFFLSPTGLAEESSYTSKGSSSCETCHREPGIRSILNMPHGRAAAARGYTEDHACETCHGPSANHLSGVFASKTMPPVVFGMKSRTPASEQNDVCLTCHQGSKTMHWEGSPHEAEEVPCASCHTVHTPRDRALDRRSQADQCADCHREVLISANRRSHHPMKEGQVICSDCHNPHGSTGEALLTHTSGNENCYACHAELRGPFLWEHAPVRDDCSICHTSHGSNQVALLKARTPWLCQECHQENYHPSSLYSGTGLPGAGASPDLLGKDCMNCHPKVHGSNHPSGARFTR